MNLLNSLLTECKSLVAKPTGCFRACGILLDSDCVSEVHRIAVGALACTCLYQTCRVAPGCVCRVRAPSS